MDVSKNIKKKVILDSRYLAYFINNNIFSGIKNSNPYIIMQK
jgi:hypothetical protein